MEVGVTSPFNKALAISSIPVGQKGKVHIWGQNIGITWTVTDPDGLLAEQYSDWSYSKIDPGDVHEFTGDSFEFFKEGPYAIKAHLFMLPDNPTVIDSYDGALCTIVAEAPPDEEEPDEEEPDEEEPTPKEIDWGPMLLIGGGLALAAVVFIPKKTKA